MNAKMKRRMIAVGGVIVVVVILLLAFLGGGNAAKVISAQEALSGDYVGKKVQVTGTVIDNSYNVDSDGVLTFRIAGDDDPAQAHPLSVSYDKGVSATFGNGVTAICTGRMGQDGTLTCTELVTKCPSKYENASTALTVDELLGYDGDTMVGTTVKVSGPIQTGSIKDATAAQRLVIQGDGVTLAVVYSGALPDGVSDGASVVVTGALQADGTFLASDISLEA